MQLSHFSPFKAFIGHRSKPQFLLSVAKSCSHSVSSCQPYKHLPGNMRMFRDQLYRRMSMLNADAELMLQIVTHYVRKRALPLNETSCPLNFLMQCSQMIQGKSVYTKASKSTGRLFQALFVCVNRESIPWALNRQSFQLQSATKRDTHLKLAGLTSILIQYNPREIHWTSVKRQRELTEFQ